MNALASSGQLRGVVIRRALVCVPLLVLLGVLSGQLSGDGAGDAWFATLRKPPGFPPAILFGFVWSVLYAMMGLALALVLAARGARLRGCAIALFAVQLVLNLAWSPLFFGMHRISWALADIVMLDIAVVATILLFWRIRPSAAWLMVPYLAWILFATYLNGAILRDNPKMDGAPSPVSIQRIEF